MTLEEMRQEVTDRGYDYVSATRINRYLNRAYQRICARHLWPFLETEVTSPAPLAMTDMRKVLAVRDADEDTLLRAVSYNYLVNNFADLSTEGTPEYWWIDNGTIRVYPVSTHNIQVRYSKVPAELTATDIPLIPERWQYLIVDRAVVDCLRDDDEYEEARALHNDVKEDISLMTGDLLHQNLQEPRTVLRTGGVGDYI